MKVYMDVCSLNRPFDDQTQAKIRLETEAVLGVIHLCALGTFEMVISVIVSVELNKNTDPMRLKKVLTISNIAVFNVPYSQSIRERADFLMESSGMKLFDALHVASAEAGGADVCLTTDVRLLKAAKRVHLHTHVKNPLDFMKEVLDDE